jgi:hypothetical protein
MTVDVNCNDHNGSRESWEYRAWKIITSCRVHHLSNSALSSASLSSSASVLTHQLSLFVTLRSFLQKRGPHSLRFTLADQTSRPLIFSLPYILSVSKVVANDGSFEGFRRTENASADKTVIRGDIEVKCDHSDGEWRDIWPFLPCLPSPTSRELRDDDALSLYEYFTPLPMKTGRTLRDVRRDHNSAASIRRAARRLTALKHSMSIK